MTSDGWVLVYRTLGLGDLLTAVPALKAIARAWPQHRRVLVTRAPLADLALHTGTVDAVIPAGELEAPAWRGPRPQVAVNLHGRGPESHRIVRAAEPARLIAFAHEHVPTGAAPPAWRGNEHDVHRWCRLLQESGVPADPGDLDIGRPEGAPAEAHGATLIHPGAAYPARRWPAERWAEVAAAESRRGRRVLVTGDSAEVALARRVAGLAGLGDAAVAAGSTDVMGLAALVAAAGRVICGDTGVAHLATALRTPSVVLFGPSSPELWGPPRDRVRHRVLWAGTTGHPNASTVHEGLLRIDVRFVLDAICELDELVTEPRTLAATTGGTP